jgi:serine protease Do
MIVMICLSVMGCESQGPRDTKSGGGSEEIVSAREDVDRATIRIEAKGSFVSAETGQLTSEDWGGSGFIIDPSGIAVTNNHVVTGAALLQVYVTGEDEPRNATVLGVSECSDLAVIDIEGKGYPYFEWHDGGISTGLDVYAAGFPLGDPEFTLTRGIVSKADVNGEMSWASVDSVIEHDATINPGSSGGPLVDDKNRVVGINYSGSSETNQYWAISSEEALEVIGQLREGQDVNSIGVNGYALGEDSGGPGVWVNSVESGSPADEAGGRAGDLITKLEGLELATDGTMADYCDIIRSRNRSDTMSIEVLRPQTEEVLQGQLNGRNLEPVVSLADNTTTATAEATGNATDSDYTTVTDDSGALEMEVPTEWSEVNGSPWEMDGEIIGRGLSASADLDAYNETWGQPGAFFGASRKLAESYSVEEYLDSMDFSDSCDYDDRYDYPFDGLYKGKYDLWGNCGEERSSFLVLAAVPENQDFLIVVEIVMISDADFEAGDRILDSFEVVGDL